jgi:hypothetical protein
VAILAAMAMLFVAIVLCLPLSAAWEDDACITHGPGRAPTSEERSLWPPGTRCAYAVPGSEPKQIFVDAGRWDPLKWPVVALLAGAPLTLAAGVFAAIRDLRADPGGEPAWRRHLAGSQGRRRGSQRGTLRL